MRRDIMPWVMVEVMKNIELVHVSRERGIKWGDYSISGERTRDKNL